MSTNTLDAGLGMLRLATSASDGDVETLIKDPACMHACATLHGHMLDT